MTRAIGLFLLTMITFGAGGPMTVAAVENDHALYAKACKHYVNRAKFRARSNNPEFVVILADSCLPALKSLGSPHAGERAAAEDYLLRLWRFRDTVIDMNMERVFGKTYTRWTRMKSFRDRQQSRVPRVSETGEYLIAYRMGLLRAYRAWLDTGPKLASGLHGAVRRDQPRP